MLLKEVPYSLDEKWNSSTNVTHWDKRGNSPPVPSPVNATIFIQLKLIIWIRRYEDRLLKDNEILFCARSYRKCGTRQRRLFVQKVVSETEKVPRYFTDW